MHYLCSTMLWILLFAPILSGKQSLQRKRAYTKVLNYEQLKTFRPQKKVLYFGQTGSFAGHFRRYGTRIRNGIVAAFKKINQEGGIDGLTLDLISVEDGNNPEQAKKNIEYMHKRFAITLFLGVMGTRSVERIVDQIRAQDFAMLFPWGGSDTLRDPTLTHLINGPGFIQPQIDRIIDYIVNDMRIKKIGIFHADSSFETVNKEYVQKVLQSHGLAPVAMSTYNRLTMNIENGIDQLLEADPKIIICLSTDTPTVKLINAFFTRGLYGTGFIGIDSTMLVPTILHDKGVAFSYTSDVGNPRDVTKPLVRKYHECLQHYYPHFDPDILSLSYFVYTTTIIHALKKVKSRPNKEHLIGLLRSFSHEEIGGFSFSFDPQTLRIMRQDISIIQG